MLASMATHMSAISIKAQPGARRPKKIMDQRVLSTNCTVNMESASRTSVRSSPLFHTRNAAIPMRRYRVVQTGAKIQLGGASSGLVRKAYQSGMAERVKSAPMRPAVWQMMMARMSLRGLGMGMGYH